MALQVRTGSSAPTGNASASPATELVSLRFHWRGPKKGLDERWVGQVNLVVGDNLEKRLAEIPQNATSPWLRLARLENGDNAEKRHVKIPQNATSPEALPFQELAIRQDMFAGELRFLPCYEEATVWKVTAARVKTLKIMAFLCKEYEMPERDVYGRSLGKSVSMDPFTVDLEPIEEPKAGEEYQIVLAGESWFELNAKIVKTAPHQEQKASVQPQEKKEEASKLASEVQKRASSDAEHCLDILEATLTPLMKGFIQIVQGKLPEYPKARHAPAPDHRVILEELNGGVVQRKLPECDKAMYTLALDLSKYILEELKKVPADRLRAEVQKCLQCRPTCKEQARLTNREKRITALLLYGRDVLGSEPLERVMATRIKSMIGINETPLFLSNREYDRLIQEFAGAMIATFDKLAMTDNLRTQKANFLSVLLH